MKKRGLQAYECRQFSFFYAISPALNYADLISPHGRVK